MQFRDGRFRRSIVKIAGAALLLAYAGSLLLFVAWAPASFGPSNAMAGAADAPSGKPGRNDHAEDDEVAILLDWHRNASNDYRSVLDGLSCAPGGTVGVISDSGDRKP